MEVYLASLMHLRSQALAFCHAFGQAASAAASVELTATADLQATQTAAEITELLRSACAFIPGAREVIELALEGAPL